MCSTSKICWNRKTTDTLPWIIPSADGLGVVTALVDKWLLAGPPADRAPKIGAMAELADILRYRLLPGLPEEVVRRPSEAFAGRTMLELIANGEHEWLLQSTKDSFDFSRVA